jgi:tRNA (cmo5U34)-methyltransferase
VRSKSGRDDEPVGQYRARPGVLAGARHDSASRRGAARGRFDDDARVQLGSHDLSEPLPGDEEHFDLVVSSFAIHHLDPPRQRVLYGEVFDRLRPGGRFINAEHVASPTKALHEEFLAALGKQPDEDDPSNQLVGTEEHLRWLNGCGFVNVECFWKWRELAVVAGTKPVQPAV